MDQNQITNLLTTLLSVFIVVLFVLVFIYIMIALKNRKGKSSKANISKEGNSTNKTETIGTTKSVYDFIEFEDVQDNMIIQKGKFKYLMVVECQGINYDLMSNLEKNGVEEGFLQFLNSLRHPVQLYVQTRTVNLENSINTYKNRLAEIEAELYKKNQEYDSIKDDPNIPDGQKQKSFYAAVKQNNLYEYGKDIIANTQRMSLNKNILNKKYYVIVPYYPTDLGENKFDEYEIRNIAFSELYTRAQSVIRTLSGCGVKGKILNSRELIELLYFAYNRDHAEEFSLDKAIQAQYDKLYTTSEDVYQKKIRELDQKIEEAAIEKAREKVEIAKSETEKEAIKKRQEMEDMIDEIAKIVLEANREYIGDEVTDKAKEKVDEDAKKREKTLKKEGKVNAKEEKTRTRRASSK